MLTPFSVFSFAQRCCGWGSIHHPSDTVLYSSAFFRTGSHVWLPRSKQHLWARHPYEGSRHRLVERFILASAT